MITSVNRPSRELHPNEPDAREVRDRSHPEYSSAREWLGERFDPEQFSAAETNRKAAPQEGFSQPRIELRERSSRWVQPDHTLG